MPAKTGSRLGAKPEGWKAVRALKKILGLDEKSQDEPEPSPLESLLLPDQQRDNLERDITILEDEYGEKAKRLHEEAEKQVQDAAEDSVKDLHVIQMGMCPRCGEHLSEHLYATICKACGWNTFEVPQHGPVRVHLRDKANIIEGEHCYVLTTGDIFVVHNDVVIAKVPHDNVSWIEYVWTDEEISQRYKQTVARLKITCAWCNGPADPEKEGFSLVQVAFGATQERYVFCSSECYEAFRKMYPSRVHRNCYETKCADCNLCVKRYDDENDGIRLIAKDLLKIKNVKK